MIFGNLKIKMIETATFHPKRALCKVGAAWTHNRDMHRSSSSPHHAIADYFARSILLSIKMNYEFSSCLLISSICGVPPHLFLRINLFLQSVSDEVWEPTSS